MVFYTALTLGRLLEICGRCAMPAPERHKRPPDALVAVDSVVQGNGMLVERRTIKSVWSSLAIGALCIGSLAARAVSVPDLYEVTIPIEQSRDTAFVEALKSVAVRVSGRRDAGARLGPAVNSPRQYVQRFAFTSDNQLQVAFDSGSVDRLLGEAGLPIWGRERPATLVLLSVPTSGGATNWVDMNYPSPEREAMVRVARQRGVPLAWPSLNAQDRGALGSATTAAAPELAQFASRSNANAVLLGHARRDPTGALVVQWSLASDDGVAEATGSVDEGVHLAADTFGRIYAASGASLGTVSVEVAGIRDLNDYAATLNYLEGMTLVRTVALEQVVGDTMRFQLAVRGDATTLRRALALDSRLVPSAPTDAPSTDRLQLRFNR
jgi:uncharacterized protein